MDGAGNFFVAGNTTSTNFPTINAFQAQLGGSIDVTVVKIDAAGKPIFSTYFGGRGDEFPRKIIVDAKGDLYIFGTTNSKNFPVKNAFQSTYNKTKMDTL